MGGLTWDEWGEALRRSARARLAAEERAKALMRELESAARKAYPTPKWDARVKDNFSLDNEVVVILAEHEHRSVRAEVKIKALEEKGLDIFRQVVELLEAE